MAHKYTATFSDGFVKKRTSKDRIYTHAWRYVFTTSEGKQWTTVGFAGSLQLAQKEISTRTNGSTQRPTRGRSKNLPWSPSKINFSEIVKVVRG